MDCFTLLPGLLRNWMEPWGFERFASTLAPSKTRLRIDLFADSFASTRPTNPCTWPSCRGDDQYQNREKKTTRWSVVDGSKEDELGAASAHHDHRGFAE
jgi:hypothetical protein